MASATPTAISEGLNGEAVRRAADLLSQQIWCWGQDVVRPEGNWLCEAGFERIAAPADRENCSSVYRLELPRGRRVVLRGFGVFYGDDPLGGVFLKRYEFRPRYSQRATLETMPWSAGDLPRMLTPTGDQQDRAATLTVELIAWIAGYEATVIEQLGVGYRRATLDRWSSNKRPLVAAEAMTASWQGLGAALTRDPSPLFQ